MATPNTANLDFSDLTGEDNDVSEGERQSTLSQSEDICRVCRVGSLPGRPLFHPCVCTGSIRYIHQDCLVQWLKHSRKEFCELCMHRFEFVPIYRPDMPKRLRASELVGGLLKGVLKNVRHWLHLGFVIMVWLAIVPICICESYLLFLVVWLLVVWLLITSFPLQLISLENLFVDGVYGLLIVFVSLLGFISMVWLKDQLGNGGAPNWLARDQQEVDQLRQREARNVPREARENAPERQDVNTELVQLQEKLATEMRRLRELERAKFQPDLDFLELQRNRLLEGLGRSEEQSDSGVRHRATHSATTTSLTSTENERTLNPSAQRVGHTFSDRWEDRRLYDEYNLNTDYSTAGQGTYRSNDFEQLHSVEDDEQLHSVEDDIQETMHQKELYQAAIQQALNVYDNINSDEAEMDDLLHSEQLGIEERSALSRIQAIKEEISMIAQRDEDDERQEDEDDDDGEADAERWDDRRGQDQVNVPRHPHANIVPALAGLARDQPIDAANGAQENMEELTWARLLGLDGSFRFLEHVVWLICLNSALIIAFVYLPYQLGYFTALIFNLWKRLGVETWKGLFSTLFGYVISITFISGVYYFTGMLRLPRLKSILGMTYVGIKVGLVLAVEAGIFPLLCGWWIDICSFALFGSTMKSRQASLSSAPGTVIFIHWLVGMIFIFYLASLVLLMREVVRPGVLWFLRNLNDQNFHPIHEMIALPLERHLRRFLLSCIMFGVCLVVVLFIPSHLILLVAKDFLPYRLTLSSSFSPVREVQLELVLLQFVIPTLLEHGNCKAGIKVIIKGWAHFSARIFGLQSYLLDIHQSRGVIVDLHGNPMLGLPINPDPSGPVYTGDTQVLGPGYAPFKPYLRPSYFYARMTVFLLFTLMITVFFCCFFLVMPVSIGRFLMSIFGVTQAPEMYTAAIGLYTLWLVIRFGTTVTSYIMQGTEMLVTQVKVWSLQGVKCGVAGFLLFVVIPLLLGHLVDLFLISPLRVPRDRTPVFYPSTEWALGLLHTKCTCGAIWLTNISFKAKLDRLYQDGLRNLNLGFVIKDVAWPVIVPLSLFITVPYVMCIGLLPGLDIVTSTNALLVYRYFFPSILVILLIIAFVVFIVKQLRRIYIHIKNEKYLIGRQLVNYGMLPEKDERNMAEETTVKT